jgi:hypothetical protein
VAADDKPTAARIPKEVLGLAVVQKSYWGFPWWDHKIVIFTFFVRGGSGFERGEVYFVDGDGSSRGLTQFLPVFETHCTRTGALKYPELDLRALSGGAPKNSVRIMGYTSRRTSTGEWEKVPGTSVGISGPTGETVVVSGQQGLYDISGLPPGAYSVHGMAPKEGPYWAHGICIWDGS